mgnify:CR=1 FL=1
MTLHTEIHFENDVCDHLAAHGWLYAEGDAANYDRQLAFEVWEVKTEEEWEMAYYDHTGNPISAEPMSFIVNQRYVIRNTDNGWVVVTMEPSPGA